MCANGRGHELVNMVKGLGSSRQLPSSGAFGFFRLEFTLNSSTLNCDFDDSLHLPGTAIRITMALTLSA